MALAELLQLLENLSPNEPCPKLEPCRAVILRWRRQGGSYRRIQGILVGSGGETVAGIVGVDGGFSK